MENDADQAGEPARDEGERVAICSREDADEEEGGGALLLLLPLPPPPPPPLLMVSMV